MPGMPRINKKAIKIVEGVLGKPTNMEQKKTEDMIERDKRVLAVDARYSR